MKQIDEKQLLLAVGEVGDDLIARAEQPAKRRRFLHWGALAACFCLIAGLAVLPGRYGMTPENNMAGPPQSGDCSSAGAANGEGNGEESVTIMGGDFQGGGPAVPGDDPDAADGLDGDAGSVQPEDEKGSKTDPESAPLPGSKGELVLIDPADAALQVTHIRGGQTEETAVTGGDLDVLRDWAANLTPGLEMRAFAAGQSPGDSDGGEVYDFTAPGGATSFAYVVNGPADCWVLLDGQWYAVSEPADPPVLFP